MKKYTTYKFRLYPNKTQEAFFKMNFKCAEVIYNEMLKSMRNIYKTRGYLPYCKVSSYYNDFPFLKEADSIGLTVFLQYKLEAQGKQLIKVDRHFPSSQICSHCGKQYRALRNYDFKNGPYIKEWDCPYCGAHHDRDVNAAINIRNEGMRIMSV